MIYNLDLNRICLHPLFLIKELIYNHLEEKEPLYLTSLDSEKAYDSVWGIWTNAF